MKLEVISSYDYIHASVQSKHNSSESLELELDLESWKARYVRSSYWAGDTAQGIPGYSKKEEGEFSLPETFLYVSSYEDNYRTRITVELITRRNGKPVEVTLVEYEYDELEPLFPFDEEPEHEYFYAIPELAKYYGDEDRIFKEFIRRVKTSKYIELPDELVREIIEKYSPS